MKEIWVELYYHGDDDDEMDEFKALLDKRFGSDDENLFNCEKPFYMSHIGVEETGYIAYIDLFDNEEFKDKDALKSILIGLVYEYLELMKKYHISSKWHSLSLKNMEEAYVETSPSGIVSEVRSYSFLPAIQSYNEDDFCLFIENLRDCIKDTASETVYGDFNHLMSLESLFDDNHENNNDMLQFNLFFWLKNRFPQLH